MLEAQEMITMFVTEGGKDRPESVPDEDGQSGPNELRTHISPLVCAVQFPAGHCRPEID